MRLIAIDPGTEKSAWVVYPPIGQRLQFSIDENCVLLFKLRNLCNNEAYVDTLAIEMVACYGMPVGRETFETVLWTGRFVEAWGGPWHKVYRRDVKLHLCNSARATDANIRRALIDRFGPGDAKAIGNKKSPGPLYKVASHVWSALSVGVYWADRVEREASMELVGSQVDVKA